MKALACTSRAVQDVLESTTVYLYAVSLQSVHPADRGLKHVPHVQDPRTAMTAQEASVDIAKVLNRRFQPNSRGSQQAGLQARIQAGGGSVK